MKLAALYALIFVINGCSSSAPARSAPTTASSSTPATHPAPDATTTSSAPPLESPTSSGGEASPKPPLAPPKQAEEIDINYEDCTVLATTYKKVWLRDALEKDATANDPKRAERAEENLREAAETAGENWLKACARVVGARMVRKNLVCASRAKTLQRFNDCYDGKAD